MNAQETPVSNQAAAPVDTHATSGTGRQVRFHVSRFKKGDERSHYQDYDVEIAPATTVLDALTAIRRDQDPSLILRHSCYHASCGTCGMRVNDREALACVTTVSDLDSETVKVEPIANQALVADLVTDMVDFYDRFRAIDRPLIRKSEAPADAEVAPGVEQYSRYESCIECGLCLSACPIVASDGRYLGPAALAAAQRTVDEPRGMDTFSVFRLTDDAQAAWRCHLSFECTEACPSNVDPAGAIMFMRRTLAARRVKSIFGAGRRS
jgi:succinate dehydrogenase / fumarate reductase, iron-sulfur subunit